MHFTLVCCLTRTIPEQDNPFDFTAEHGIRIMLFICCHLRNPIFLTAIQRTLQSLRRALFGEQFWKDFTNTAKTFDKLTRAKIFCTSQARKRAAAVMKTKAQHRVDCCAVSVVGAVENIPHLALIPHHPVIEAPGPFAFFAMS